jgi:hypothetical protein
MLLALVALGGCSKPPGELHLDTSVKELIGQGPGLYELYAPFDIPARGPNLVFLRQGKDMIIASGDSIQEKIDKYMAAGDFSLIGRRMGQPKIWFSVDGIVVKGNLVEPIGHRLDWKFPSYEPFARSTVEGYQPVDLTRFDLDQEKAFKELVGRKARITGALRIEELESGGKRYLVESRNLKLELTPVGQNLGYFLDLAGAVDTPLVVYGSVLPLSPMNHGPGGSRGSTPILGGFTVDFLRYSQDILVRNTAGTAGA